MKSKLVLLMLAAGLLSGCTFFARWTHKSAPASSSTIATGSLVEPAASDAAWLDKARADYPLKTCLVSGDELGGMSGVIDRIYRVPGQPDRLVRFCCDGCPDMFKDDPAKYLKLLDAPARPVAKPGP